MALLTPLQRRLGRLTRVAAQPATLLARVHWAFLMLALTWTAVTIVRVLVEEPDRTSRLAAVATVLTLVLLHVESYRRAGPGPVLSLAETIVIAAGVAFDGPYDWTTSLLIGVVFLRGSQARNWWTAAGTVLTWTAAIMAGQLVSNAVGQSAGSPIGWSDLPSILVMVGVLIAPARLVAYFVGRYDEAMARERALLSAGAALVATGSPHEVGAVAVRAASGLVPPDARVRWLTSHEAGPDLGAPNGPLDWNGDVTVIDAAGLERLRAPLELRAGTRWLAGVVVGTGEHRHLLLVEGTQAAEASVVDALGALAATLTTGMRAVATTTHLRRQALEDPLTGLANRAHFEQRLADAVQAARSSGPTAALLLIDLDGFKQVNDSLGHSAGDAVLVAVADRLRSCTRTTDLIARLGGDDFVLLLTHPGESLPDLAGRITLALAAPIVVDGRPAPVSGSVGAVVVEPGVDGAELVRRADNAMYRAKAAGKATFAISGSAA